MAVLPDRLDTSPSKSSLIGQKVRGRYFVESRIGGGTFGNVYSVIDLESSLRVDGLVRRAMKVIDVADPNPPRIPPPNYVNYRLTHATREIYYHNLVSPHPNIVALHEWFLMADREEMFLILDYCSGGDLRTYIARARNRFDGDDGRMKQIILQICGAVDFIHSKGIFHKDLKPQNILISRDGCKVFLCDFGLATDIRTDTRGGGTAPYMGPELLTNRGFYCPKRADAWTLGVIILNMLGLSPWDSASVRSRRFRDFMLSDDYILQARRISPEANDLIRDILRFHPELRLSIPEISSRVLRIRSFFNNPRIRFTKAELREMESTHRSMFMRLDPIARRRKELEYLRCMDKTSAYNDLSGRLPSPHPPLRRIRARNSSLYPPGEVIRSVSDIPSPERCIIPHENLLRIDNVMVAGADWDYL